MKKLLFIHAITPIHIGVGQSVSAVDLPIMRDKTTGIPLVPGSSLKGCLRAKATNMNGENGVTKEIVCKIFGPEKGDSDGIERGNLIIGDANLACLPVRSIAGTFAYVTSPWLLTKLKRDLEETKGGNLPKIPDINTVDRCSTTSDTILKQGTKIYFEDLDFSAFKNDADEWAKVLADAIFTDDNMKNQFKKRFCIVHDDVMSFLCQHGTQIVTRNSIDQEKGTAADGQLWTEENLPVETILCSFIEDCKTADESAIKTICQKSLQLGGKATIGHGRCELHLVG